MRKPAPICAKIPKTLFELGHTREDPYFWLREKENPKVKEYVLAENDYFRETLSPIEALTENCFEQMKALLEREAVEVPYRMGSYWYGSRIPETSQYPVYFRRAAIDDQKSEEILLDLNGLLQNKDDYLDLQGLAMSHDEKYMAFSLDEDGSEHGTISIKELSTGQILPRKIGEKRAHGSPVWSADGKYLFYGEQNDQDRPDTIIRHELKTGQEEKVFVEKDPRFFVSVGLSKDKKLIFIESESKESSETWFVAASLPTNPFQLILPRREGHLYRVEPQGNRFLILTNSTERNFRLMSASLQNTAETAWKEILRGDEKIDLRDLEVYASGFAVLYGDLGTLKVAVYESQSQKDHKIRDLAFHEPVYEIDFLNNVDYQSTSIRLSYSSPKTPPQTLQFDFKTGAKTLLHERKIEGYDPSCYETKKIFAPSHDGVLIPVSIVYRKDKGPLPRPTILVGYGSYGVAYSDGFRTSGTHLSDLGFVYAIAHIRGGGCLGQRWYDEGKFLKKKNTFLDFNACAEALGDQKFATPHEISSFGGSAGGMLVTAAMNLRPDLYKSVAAIVPFVDVISTMWDESLPLTPTEFDEWGNPKDPKFYETMLSYSPYDQIEKKNYPHLYMTCGWNDPRVTYWEPAKFAARMRERRTNQNLTLLWTNMEAGHAGRSGRFETIREYARINAFFYALHFQLAILELSE